MERFASLLLATAVIACPAKAGWLKAESRHFIIYANEAEAKLRADAERLEKFDLAVRAVRKMDDPALDAGGKVTVFMLPLRQVQDLAGDDAVYGFYDARADGPVAFVAKATDGTSIYDLSSQQIFFHEYSHHLMFLDLQGWAPVWFVEGFAEFYASPSFEKDGTVVLGRSPAYRSYSINSIFRMPLEQMLADKFDKVTGEERESLYGRGWALTHLMTFEPSRRGQLAKYLTAMRKGADPKAAATSAFGDLKALDRAMTEYANRPNLLSLRVPGALIKVGPIDIRPMGPSAERIMPLLVRTRRGVDVATAGSHAAKVRLAAAPFGNDPLAQIALAEAELDAGNNDAAIAAADQVLATRPQDVEAMMLKAAAYLSLAKKGSDTARNSAAARQIAIAANKLAPEDPEPLIKYYDSFAIGKAAMPAAAVKGVHYALALAPFDNELRLKSAMAHISAHEWAEARSTLEPLAHNAHSPSTSERARLAIAAIDRRDADAAIKAMTEKTKAKS